MPALLFCLDGKHLENGTFRQRWRHDNLMVSWKRCVFNSSGLGWKKTFHPLKKRRKKCISIFSILVLSPVYTEKLCPGEEGHPPSPVNFSERLYEKKDNPFTGAKSWQQRSHKLWLSHLDWVDLAGWAKVFIWRKVATLRGWSGYPQVLAEPTICSSCGWLTNFVTKYGKSWHRVNAGRRVTVLLLLPGKSFLHMNGTLGLLLMEKQSVEIY